MRIVHCWDVPELRVLEIESNFAVRIKKKILSRFNKVKEAVNFYKDRFNYSFSHTGHAIALLINGKLTHNVSADVNVLVYICEDNDVSREELEKSLKLVKGSRIKNEYTIKAKYPLIIPPVPNNIPDKNLIHAWNIPDLSIQKFDINLAQKLRNLIILRFGTLTKCIEHYSNLTNYKHAWTKSLIQWIINGSVKRKKDSIPLDFMIFVCEDNGISRYQVEKSLERIKVKFGELSVLSPKFPIKVDPVFVSLATHFYGDGCHSQYSQALFHVLNRKRFFQKVEHCVGRIENWKNDKKDFAVPTIVYKYLEGTLGITKENIRRKVFPKTIFQLPKEYKIASLAAFIMDEGKVKYSIEIKQKRKHLLKVFHEFCQELCYDVSPIKKFKGDRKYFGFRIRIEGMHRFYEDLKKLIDCYGNLLDIGNKQKELEEVVERHIKTKHTK
jgi:hypothetical protein